MENWHVDIPGAFKEVVPLPQHEKMAELLVQLAPQAIQEICPDNNLHT